jgi:hypothetical protein
MKKIILVLILLLLAAPCWADATRWNINVNPTSDWFSTNRTYMNVPLMWMRDIDDLVELGTNPGTGSVYYVDSGVTNEGDGTSWDNAKNTLDEAIALCSGNDDYILVAQTHEENLSAADGVDVDQAGVTIIGCGNRADMPEFSFTQSAGEFVIGAANVTVYNLRFIAATGSITMGISVEAAGDNFTLAYCEFPEPTTSSWEFLDAIDLASTANGFRCIGNRYYHTGATGPAHFIEAGNGTNHDMSIIGNEIQGQFSVAAIWSDTIDLRLSIFDNVIRQMTSGQFAIEFTTTALGVYGNNRIYTDAEATSIAPGSMVAVALNWVTTAINASPVPFPAPDDTAQNFIGVNDADNAVSTSTVAANEDGSILERLENIEYFGKQYISKAMTSVKSSTPNLFDVAGGPILITDFYGHVTTLIGATTTTLEIFLDADSGWVDYDFSTAVAITSLSAGDRIVFSAANESVLTPLSGADGGTTSLFKSWLCGEGMIEATASTNDNDGAITWYMEYVPLATGVTVTAQ